MYEKLCRYAIVSVNAKQRVFRMDFEKIIGVDVFLEKSQKRAHVGMLEKRQGQFCFEYTPAYFKAKKSFPLGPEFPLTRKTFFSKKLFPSFTDRLPDPENPAYSDYCAAVGISITTTDPFILLTTIGKRGPSSFIFEPIYDNTFTFEDYKKFQKYLGLSTQEFSRFFDISMSSLPKIKAGQTSGKEILKRIELYKKIPQTLKFFIKKNSKYIHPKKMENLIKKMSIKC